MNTPKEIGPEVEVPEGVEEAEEVEETVVTPKLGTFQLWEGSKGERRVIREIHGNQPDDVLVYRVEGVDDDNGTTVKDFEKWAKTLLGTIG
jgi:hypothetical protein